MTDNLTFLKSLISAPGISGDETTVHPLIEKEWRPITDQLSLSKMGSLHGFQQGSGAEPRPSILLAAHMDAIGFMVNAILEGFIRVSAIGGVDMRVVPGQLVTVHGRQDLPGMLVPTPSRLLPAGVQEGSLQLEYYLVDVGLLPEEVNQLVRIGDAVSFAQPPVETGGDTLVGHSLDNRASVVALTHCLELLHSRPHAWDVWAAATVQEETRLLGAQTSTFQLQPSLAVAIDVTWGSAPGSPGHLTYGLGKGPSLMWGPNVHPSLYQAMVDVAEGLDMDFTIEPNAYATGTDAVAMQVSAEGIPCLVIGIPLRYMHTPVEMVALKDITRTGRLVAEFIAQLDENFMEKLNWND